MTENIELMPLDELLRDWKVGSAEWSWDDEATDLKTRDQQKLDELANDVQTNGIQEPILLGNDGRIWDGHHRIIVARDLGLSEVPVQRV